MAEILVIDDNPEILFANTAHLSEQGYKVTAATTGAQAIAHLNEKHYDCIVLDILLPDIDGYGVCRAARQITNTPIIFLSCLDEIDHKVKGLMTGADDYMTKPYSLKELSVRIHALIRRAGMNKLIQGKGFNIDRHNRIIQTAQKNVLLSQKEFELFMLFYENPMKLFTKEYIYKRLWHGSSTDTNRVVVHIMRLRRKLEFATEVVGTIDNDYGAGYRLTPPEVQ